VLADHDPRRTGCHDQVGTGRPARGLVRAGFQRDIERRGSKLFRAEVSQCYRLGMRAATGLRPAAPDYAAIRHHQRCDTGIGAGKRARAHGQSRRGGHPFAIIGGNGRSYCPALS